MDRNVPVVDILAADHIHRRKSDLMRYEYCHEAEITSISPLIESVKLYRIRLLDPAVHSTFSFVPGQFVMLEVPGIGEAPFSISSSPSRRGDLELCIRSVGTLTSFLARCERGLRVGISGPFGTSYPLERMKGGNMLFIAGGLGTVPLRSALLAVLENRSRYARVDFLCGAKNPAFLLFADEYESWRNTDIEVQCIVDAPGEGWSGQVGMITSLVDQYLSSGISLSDTWYAIVCGPPVMFKAVCSILLAAGLPMHHMFVSLERRMHCGKGKCCRCNVGSTYTCLDGPVFDFWSVVNLKEAI